MRAPARADITGVILAGGRGTRMGGRDKGWVEYRGRPLVEHVLERITPQVDSVIISANRNIERYAALGHAVVNDGEFEYHGPLAGILSAAKAAATDWMFVVPVDAPLFSTNLAQQLARGLGTAPLVWANDGERDQYAFCLVKRESALFLNEELTAGRLALREWLARSGGHAVDVPEPEMFRSFNRLIDTLD
ncbi:MAG: molybdenum cofactor guanylyltransferase [Chromatiales bacterium]|nr:molybdenum cofactor guanylyltransferase [Chromatiales bacterium]